MCSTVIILTIVLFFALFFSVYKTSQESFRTVYYNPATIMNPEKNPYAIDPGFGLQLGKLENNSTDPLDPALWKQIQQRVSLYPGGFADVVMKLEDRNQIPAIKNLSV